jgi:hypothetical protein
MYELDFALQAVTILGHISAAASRFESAVYRADDWFQAHVVPASKHYALVVVAELARSGYLAFVAGKATSEWYQKWFCEYISQALPAMIEQPQPMLCSVAYAGYLMPASEADKVVGKPILVAKKQKRKTK